jgi:uncharacterized membrane protein
MTGLYTGLKVVHVLAVVLWLGGATMLATLAIRARRRSGEALVSTFGEVARLAPRIFVPASLVLVVTGFGLLATGSLPYRLWVILAIVGWTITFLTGLLVLTPQTKRAESLLEEHGTASEVALGQVQQVQQVLLLARIDLVVLTLVVIDMVVKPG